jgi:hypothetical protein
MGLGPMRGTRYDRPVRPPIKRSIAQSVASQKSDTRLLKSHGHGPRGLSLHNPETLLVLQRPAGNTAVTGLLGLRHQTVQRQGTTSSTAGKGSVAKQVSGLQGQVTDLKSQMAVMEKRTASTALDNEYRGIVGERLSAYRQGIYRLTGSFQGAINGFQGAQTKQAQSDAIKAQLIATLISVAAAGVAEPLLTAGLGKLGAQLGKDAGWVGHWTESLENKCRNGRPGEYRSNGSRCLHRRKEPNARGWCDERPQSRQFPRPEPRGNRNA